MTHEFMRDRAYKLSQENIRMRRKLQDIDQAARLWRSAAVIALLLLTMALFLPVPACAAEQPESWVSVVIRCQQSSDTCVKRELVYPTEEACEDANARVVATIGNTKDIVIAYCVEAGE